MQLLVHRLLHLFVGPERLASRRLFEWSKDVKITWRGLASTANVVDTRRTDLGYLRQLNGRYRGQHCHVATKPLYLKSMSFGFDGRTQVILEEICICFTGHSLTPGHVVLQNYHSFIPKENQHNLSHRWLCAEFSQFWWGGTAPFLARILGFQLVVVDPDFISSNSSY